MPHFNNVVNILGESLSISLESGVITSFFWSASSMRRIKEAMLLATVENPMTQSRRRVLHACGFVYCGKLVPRREITHAD